MGSGWQFLTLSVLAEVVATFVLKHTDGMTRLLPTAFMAGAFALSFWLFSLALRTMPLGLAYAVWAGGSTALVTALGAVVFGDRITAMSAACVLLIIGGIVGLHLSSQSH